MRIPEVKHLHQRRLCVEHLHRRGAADDEEFVLLRLEGQLLAAPRDLGDVLILDELARVTIWMVGRT